MSRPRRALQGIKWNMTFEALEIDLPQTGRWLGREQEKEAMVAGKQRGEDFADVMPLV